MGNQNIQAKEVRCEMFSSANTPFTVENIQA